jgi:hypothetical protein
MRIIAPGKEMKAMEGLKRKQMYREKWTINLQGMSQ